MEKDIPEIFERCRKLIAERRENPTDDLTSVLVHAEVDGEKLEEHEIVMGFFLLMAAGNDSTKATYCSGMRALMEDREQMQLLLEDPSLHPGAVEESLRMFPAFAHFRRTATCDTELHGQKIREGEKVVMWYVSSNRDETRYEDPDRFDLRRKAEHQAFGAGGRHFCLGTALARLELKILIEETLKRFPAMTVAGTPTAVESRFVNQLEDAPGQAGAVDGGCPMDELQPRVRLRQAVIVAAELEPVASALRSALGLGEPFRDPGVGEFGLTNAVFALGDCFLEVISPAKPGTAAGRYLERHDGDGGYMAIFDLTDLDGARARADAGGDQGRVADRSP